MAGKARQLLQLLSEFRALVEGALKSLADAGVDSLDGAECMLAKLPPDVAKFVGERIFRAFQIRRKIAQAVKNAETAALCGPDFSFYREHERAVSNLILATKSVLEILSPGDVGGDKKKAVEIMLRAEEEARTALVMASKYEAIIIWSACLATRSELRGRDVNAAPAPILEGKVSLPAAQDKLRRAFEKVRPDLKDELERAIKARNKVVHHVMWYVVVGHWVVGLTDGAEEAEREAEKARWLIAQARLGIKDALDLAMELCHDSLVLA